MLKKREKKFEGNHSSSLGSPLAVRELVDMPRDPAGLERRDLFQCGRSLPTDPVAKRLEERLLSQPARPQAGFGDREDVWEDRVDRDQTDHAVHSVIGR